MLTDSSQRQEIVAKLRTDLEDAKQTHESALHQLRLTNDSARIEHDAAEAEITKAEQRIEKELEERKQLEDAEKALREYAAELGVLVPASQDDPQ